MTTFTAASGVQFLGQFTGLLKKFRLTKVNEKDREILTLANLDSGYIRKFVVRKVDEPVPPPSCNGGPPRTRIRDGRAKYMPSVGPAIPPRTEPLPKLSEVSENEKTKADLVDGDVLKNHSKNELVDDDVVKNNVKNEKKNEEASEKQGQDEKPLQNGGVDNKKLPNGTAGKTEEDVPRSPQPLSNGRVMNLSSPKPRRKKKSKTKKSRFSLGTNATSSSSNTDETDDEEDSKKKKRNKTSSKGAKVEKEYKSSKSKNLNNNNTDKNVFGESNSKIEIDDDPGVCNPAYTQEENGQQDDESDSHKDYEKKSKRKKSKHFEEESDSSSESSLTVNDSPTNSPRIHGFRSLRNSPASHRSGLQSGRSSVSSVRKGILKKSGSCVTINIDLGQQNGINKSNPSSIVDDPNDLADGARPESLPGDPQRTINRVKFILDSGKPDNISGSYDDIRIEMIEKDRMDRMDRGKSQETGYKGLSKSGRKCLLFCAGLLVLTIAVIVGSFVGSGKLRQVGSRFTGLALASDSGYGLANRYVKNAIEVKFRITNESFTPELRRPETEEYQALAQLLEKELKNILVTSEIEYNGNSALKFKIIKFDPGSIVTTFRIGWLFIDPNTTPPPPLNITIVRSRLEEHIKTNGGAIAKYQVPVDTLSVDRVVDICSNNASLCSNECFFSHETLRFSCLCPDFMILVDQTTCIDQKAATTTTTTEVYLNDIFSEIFSKIGGNVALISIKNEQKDAKGEDDEDSGSEVIASNETSTTVSPSSTASSPASTTETPSTTAITPANVTTVFPPDIKTTTSTKPSIQTNETVSSTTPTTDDRNVSEASSVVETQGEGTIDETVEETVDKPPIETAVMSSSSTTESPPEHSSVEAQSSTTTVSTTVQQSSTSSSAPQQSSTSAGITQQPLSTESDTQKPLPASTTTQSSASVTQQSTTSPTPQQSSTPLPAVFHQSSTSSSTIPQQSSTSSSTIPQQSSTSTETPQPSALTTSTLEPSSTSVSPVSSGDIPIVVPESLDSNEVEQSVLVAEAAQDAENSSVPTAPEVTSLSTTSTITSASSSTSETSSTLSSTSSTSTTPKTSITTETSTAALPTTTEKIVGHVPIDATGTNSSIDAPLTHESDAKEIRINDTVLVTQFNITTEAPLSASTTPTSLSSVSTEATSESLTPYPEKSVPEVNLVHEELPKTFVSNSTADHSQVNQTIEILMSTTEVLNATTPTPQTLVEKSAAVNEVDFSEPNITLPTSVISTSPNSSTSSGEVQNKVLPTASDSVTSTTIEVIKAEVLDVNDGNLANNTPPPVPTTSSTTPHSILSTSTASASVQTPKVTSSGDQALSESVSVEKILAGERNDSMTESDPELLWSFNNVIPTLKAQENSSTTKAPSGLCSDDMHECGGRCLPRIRLCDAVPDCADGSDEIGCVKNSCFLNFQCWSGDCVARRLVCDGVTDCPGGDDEQGCNTWSCLENEFRCESTVQDASMPPALPGGPCLPLSLRCDGQPDCFNHTDERDCLVEEKTACDKDKFQCPEGWCIPDGWRCDGMTDCEHGEDEVGCECAGLDEAACAVGGCVPTFHLCDGLRQCPDGSDEWGCVRIRNSTRRLEVRSGASLWRSVCGDGWTSAWSDLVCEQLVGGNSVSTEVRRVQSPAPNDSGVVVPRPRVSLASDASTRSRTPLQYALSLDQCSSDALVHLKCHHDECGSWDYSPPDPEGTEPDETSQWPSMAILLHTPLTEDELPENTPAPSFTHPCAASILSPMWLITAYSCLASQPGGLKPDTWAVVTGEGAPSTKSSSAQLKHVSQVLRYPGAKRQEGLWTGDLALIRLVSPLNLDRHTRAVCVASGRRSPPSSPCVFANWRPRLREGRGPPFWLQLQALPGANLVNLTTCNSTHYRGRLSNAHMCAQLETLQPAPCHGDEGSPLMCQSSDGTWHLEGLLSHHSNCGTAKHPAIFTATYALETWILNTIGMANSPKFVQRLTAAKTSLDLHGAESQTLAVEKESIDLAESKANDLNTSAPVDADADEAAIVDLNSDPVEKEDTIFGPKSVETVVAPLIGDSLNPTDADTVGIKSVNDGKSADIKGNAARESRGETLENGSVNASENAELSTDEKLSADTIKKSADLITNESSVFPVQTAAPSLTVTFSPVTHTVESSLHPTDPDPVLIVSQTSSFSPASSMVSVSSSVSSSTSSATKEPSSSSDESTTSTTPPPSPSSPLLSALTGGTS